MVPGKYSEWGDNCTDVTKKREKWQEAGCPMHLLKVCWFPCTACPVRHPPMCIVETQSGTQSHSMGSFKTQQQTNKNISTD